MLNCCLCFNLVADSAEAVGIDEDSNGNGSPRNLIQKYFNFAESIMQNDSISHKQSLICTNCFGNLEAFHLFHNLVSSNYGIITIDKTEEGGKFEVYEAIAEEVLPESDEYFVFEDETGKVDNPSLIKNEPPVVFEEESVWTEELFEKKEKTPSPTSSRAPKNTSISFDSADDQRIRETACMNCDLCGELVDSLRDAKSHFKTVHFTEGYIVCCERKFKQRCRLVEHVLTHYNYSYSCSICGKTFDSRSYLTKHLACHDDNKQFQCDHCPKTFSRKFQVRNHLLSVHIYENVEPTFVCPIDLCSKKFVNYARLKHHLDYTHSSNHIEICEICSKHFRTKNAVEEHMKTHARRAEDRIRCEICGHFLADLKSYNRHIKNHETESLDNTCNYCGKRSPNLNALKKHIKFVHEMSKNYKCRFCDKSFKRSRNLIDHEAAMHTLQDLYSCDFCEKTFRNQSNMLAHRKKQHPDLYQKPAYMRA